MSDACKSCAAPIRWVITEKGRRMPVDPEPSPAGNLLLTQSADRKRVDPFASVVPVGSQPTLYTSHFATCANAEQHRRAK